MPLKPHPTDPDKLVYESRRYMFKDWVGLSDEEIEASKPPLSNDAVVWELAVEWAQAQLKEKNT